MLMKHFLRLVKISGLCSLAAAMWACADGKSNTINQQQAGQTAGAADANPNSALGGDPAVDPSSVVPANAALLDATFDMNATSMGMPMCTGNIQIKVNAGFSQSATAKLFDIPAGTVDCGLFGKIDLTQVLGAFSGTQPPVVQDNVIAMKQIGDGLYDPPRPMLPSFIAGSKDALAHLSFTKSITINSTKEGKTATGQVRVRTLSFDQPYKPPKMQRTFKHVIDFEIVNTNFDGVEKVTNALFDRMEFRISLDPVAILSISFKGKVADFMAAQASLGAGAVSGGIGSMFAGAAAPGGLLGMIVQGITSLIDVELNATLVSQQGMVDSNAAANDSSSDDGEKIGGKTTSDD